MPWLRILLSTGLLLAACSGTSSAVEPIRFAPLPMENREATVRAFNPLVEHLQRRLGQPVSLVYFDRYDDILDAFANGLIDIAFVGPLPYVTLRQRHPDTEPLLRFREPDGRVEYRCALIAFAGDDIDLARLRGKRVGLTQRLSTCGYLGTHAILRKQAGIGLEDTDHRYLGSHENVALAVVAGEVDVGGVKDEYATRFAPLGITVLAWSDPVPATGLAANRATLGEERIALIRRILLDTPASVYSTWGKVIAHGMDTVDDADFEALRRFGDPATIPPEPRR
ncbi:MAG: PhnD/SsuA/transferrin family substrate-binding protein [Chromatiales bacterium]|jgi:phosphonate transport system substrate-binding protein|nr:PhnD/SsuA/transferrin family substrate-binding protein [Chromatiales bacterium]MDX9766158.1 PhnD/SsuA/transferrin family substrate-binding protein [Ectothiorhodospiraceae bacterium]